MVLPLLILGITNVFNILLVGLTLFRRRDNSSKGVLGVFTLSIISLVIWSTSNYLADTSTNIDSALFWTRASFPPALFMCWFVFYFTCLFPVRRPNRYPYVWLYGTLVLILSIFSMGHSVVTSVGIETGVGISDVEVGSMYLPVLGLYLGLIIHATINLIYDVRQLTGRARTQVSFVLMGWGIFLSFAVITNAILPLLTGSASWSKFGPLGSVFMVACISYAMIKHEFLDIKFIIQRGLVFSILLSILLVVYVCLLFITQLVFNNLSETNVGISAFITALIGVFSVSPLTDYFKKITSPVFFRDSYDYKAVLAELSSVLNENIEEEVIINKVTQIFTRDLKSKTVNFYLGNKSPISTELSELSFEIKSNGQKIGLIVLGEKLSGDTYTREDVSLISTFASQAGVALEKARLYSQIKDYADTLEVKVSERTGAIEALQKEQESMMLEISHGLQTPLTIMKGELFFLRKQGYEMEKIDTIDASINRISVFIKKLLDLYRLQGAVIEAPSPVSLRELITDVVLSFRGSLDKTNDIEIMIEAPAEVIVMGDRDSLEEVLSNLISNAIKYSDKSRKNIIKVDLNIDSDNLANIKVADTGMGMQEEDRQQLFKKFYRVKNAETRQIPGTGLGLAICLRLVEMHAGKILVDSVAGQGTTFIIKLPRE